MKKILALAAILICGATKPALAQWSLSGNADATGASKLGTTKLVPLRLYTNNTIRLHINATNGNAGFGTLNPLQKLDINGNLNLSKNYGLYIDNRRVLWMDSASGSVFLGNRSGEKNNAPNNTATGFQSLANNTLGFSNTADGAFALYTNRLGFENVANGMNALLNNATGSLNTATGAYALYSNITGQNNVATGRGALYYNTSGFNNAAVGTAAMYYSGEGSYNSALGQGALLHNRNGAFNTAVGFSALSDVFDMQGNTAIGSQAGAYVQHGYYNIFLGAEANATLANLYNTIALGVGTKVTAPNQVRIGNTYTNSIGGYTSWSNISDGRVKRNIRENVPGLEFINKLKPVTYNLDLDAADKIMGVAAKPGKDDNLGKEGFQSQAAARAAKQSVVYTGFVAQEVEKAARELNYDFSGVDAAKNENDLYALRYADFVVPLVKAVQELSNENKALKSKVEKLEALFHRGAASESKVPAPTPAAVNDVFLQQNRPNPANGITRISYAVPAKVSRAQLVLIDNLGRKLQTITLAKAGVAEINTAGLSSGMYHYSLVADGKILQTKQLEIVR